MKGDYYRDLAAEFSTSDAESKAADVKFIDKVLRELPQDSESIQQHSGRPHPRQDEERESHHDAQGNNADEWNEHFQSILKALLSNLKSDMDGAYEHEPESKNENEVRLQRTQEHLDQHRHQQEQKT